MKINYSEAEIKQVSNKVRNQFYRTRLTQDVPLLLEVEEVKIIMNALDRVSE